MGCFRLFVQIYVGIVVFIYICGTIAGVLSGAGFPLLEAVGYQIFIFLTFSMSGGITYLNLTREDLNLPPKERNQVKFAAFRKCVKIYLVLFIFLIPFVEGMLFDSDAIYSSYTNDYSWDVHSRDFYRDFNQRITLFIVICATGIGAIAYLNFTYKDR